MSVKVTREEEEEEEERRWFENSLLQANGRRNEKREENMFSREKRTVEEKWTEMEKSGEGEREE